VVYDCHIRRYTRVVYTCHTLRYTRVVYNPSYTLRYTRVVYTLPTPLGIPGWCIFLFYTLWYTRVVYPALHPVVYPGICLPTVVHPYTPPYTPVHPTYSTVHREGYPPTNGW